MSELCEGDQLILELCELTGFKTPRHGDDRKEFIDYFAELGKANGVEGIKSALMHGEACVKLRELRELRDKLKNTPHEVKYEY